MKRIMVIVLALLVAGGLVVVCAHDTAVSQQIDKKDCFFLSSLHYTANGMGYWYSKERGGLETLTNVPYDNLGCKNCHTAGCDRCHKVETKEKECTIASYSTKAASKQDMCLKCHGRERAMIAVNFKNKQEDVHLKSGMTCVDCHSAREMHGDGTAYKSLKQDGAMDTKCENCHDSVKPTDSHTVHKDKLDCKACHINHVVSCTNCHFPTMVNKGKRKAIPVNGWLFLMNYQNKVSSASMQTFVTKGDKTFLMFAPHMSHAVTKEGRKCEGCHATDIMKQAQKGSINLTWLKDGKVHNLKGVIPVVDSVDYKCSYQNFVDGKWKPIAKPPKPLRQYVAFGKPLTKEQLDKLAKVQQTPPPEMKQTK